MGQYAALYFRRMDKDLLRPPATKRPTVCVCQSRNTVETALHVPGTVLA